MRCSQKLLCIISILFVYFDLILNNMDGATRYKGANPNVWRSWFDPSFKAELICVSVWKVSSEEARCRTINAWWTVSCSHQTCSRHTDTANLQGCALTFPSDSAVVNLSVSPRISGVVFDWSALTSEQKSFFAERRKNMQMGWDCVLLFGHGKGMLALCIVQIGLTKISFGKGT